MSVEYAIGYENVKKLVEARRIADFLSLPFELSSNNILDESISLMENLEINFAETASKFEKSKKFARLTRQPSNKNALFGHFYEFAIKESFAKRIEENPRTIVHNEAALKTDNYFLTRSKDGSYIALNETREVVAEYDMITLTKPKNEPLLPVLWEIKIIGDGGNMQTHKKIHYTKAMWPKSLVKRLSPLSERFATKRFGYVMVSNKDIFQNLETVEAFVKAGGKVALIPYETDELRSTFNKTAKERGW